MQTPAATLLHSAQCSGWLELEGKKRFSRFWALLIPLEGVVDGKPPDRVILYYNDEHGREAESYVFLSEGNYAIRPPKTARKGDMNLPARRASCD